MRYRTIALACLPLLALGPLTGCSDNAGQVSAATSDSKVVATVNGNDITEKDVDAYMAQRAAGGGQPNAPKPDRASVINEMINMQLIEQQAKEAGLSKRPDIQRQLEEQRTNLLVNAFIRERMKKVEISDEELKNEYEAQKEQVSGQKEYKARHILVDNEDEAKKIIEQLDSGDADFAKLAKEKSTGPSAKQGGDLGWFSPDTMVPKFADALKGMKKGAYTEQPVKTRYGWHVIKLEDTRAVEIPPFEDVKDRLRQALTNRKLQEYLQGLRQDADINIKETQSEQPPSEQAPSDDTNQDDSEG